MTVKANARAQTKAALQSRRVKNAVYSFGRAVVLIGLSFILLYPVLYIFSMAFRPSTEVLDPLVVWIPRQFTLSNIQDALSGMKYLEALWQTVRISLISSIISVIVYSLVGYCFARFQFKFKNLLFALLIIRGYWLAIHARDRFGALLIVGIITLFAFQVFFNIGVVTGLLPVTGISLPFFSYGGTALVIQLAEMGIVLSVSRQIPAPKQG